MDWKIVARTGAIVLGVLFCLYVFLVAIDMVGAGLQILLGDQAASLFQVVDNDLAGLCIGVLTTVLVQSSSTSTAIVVAMVGAKVLSVKQAIPIVMGANLGTSVTNSLVSLTFINEPKNYERAFAAASVHFIFNLLNTAFWFPVEVISERIGDGVLFTITKKMVSNFKECEGPNCKGWESPIKVMTGAFTDNIVDVNKNVLKDFALGRPSLELCSVLCEETGCRPYKFNDKRCAESDLAEFGTVCLQDASNEEVKAMFNYCLSKVQVNATVLEAAVDHYDAGEPNAGGIFYPLQWQAGLVTFLVALIMMFASLAFMVKLLNMVIRGRAEKWIKKALNVNGYVAILIGIGVTMFVQSSSITTSVLTPLAAIGAIELESMLPLTIGANIGTTITGILASLVADSVEGFQIALVHVMFNVFAAIMFYPIPFLRRIPLNGARKLGRLAYRSKPIPVVFVAFVFFIIPGVLLALSLLFSIGGTGGKIGGSVIIVVAVLSSGFFVRWYRYRGGSDRIANWLEKRHGDQANGTVEPADVEEQVANPEL